MLSVGCQRTGRENVSGSENEIESEIGMGSGRGRGAHGAVQLGLVGSLIQPVRGAWTPWAGPGRDWQSGTGSWSASGRTSCCGSGNENETGSGPGTGSAKSSQSESEIWTFFYWPR